MLPKASSFWKVYSYLMNKEDKNGWFLKCLEVLLSRRQDYTIKMNLEISCL